MIEHTLWYEAPAKCWNEALPLGNGRLGAMVFGGVERERIQLNEDSLWYGRPVDRINPDSRAHLEEVRRLIFAGKIAEAEQLCLYALSGTPQSQRVYQTLGEMILTFSDGEPAGDYRRSLDLAQALCEVRYRRGATSYRRVSFTSAPRNVLVVHLTAQGPDGLSFHCLLDRHRQLDESWAADGHTVAFRGQAGAGGVRFCCALRALCPDGSARTLGEHLIVEGGHEALLLLTAATSFREADPEAACLEALDAAQGLSFEQLFEEHLADYRRYFGRVRLELEGAGSSLPTDRRLAAVRAGMLDPGLIQLYFDYARYLLISSSRPGSLPATLQGIWNDQYLPPWDSKYTININLEMNYWMAESCGLPELHQPLFELIGRMAVTGAETARRMYGCRGFVAHHNTDLYADTAPQDHYVPATYWVMGGAWLCLHLFEHYRYTGDVCFLREHFGLIEQAVAFFEDFLVEDPKGRMVTCPSVSPENTYILPDGSQGRLCYGASMDNQILAELMDAYLQGGKVLGLPSERLECVARLRDRLPRPQVGAQGQLMEWPEDYAEAEPGHRHISHLFGVYPGNCFSWRETPELMRAARVSLTRRLEQGGGHTGWSRAWIVCLWARFGEGERALDNLNALLGQSTLANLMDSHPMGAGQVFQMDGNMGGAAGLVEMLLRSQGERVELLPALPPALGAGEVSGLRAEGALEVALGWRQGRLRWVRLTPTLDRRVIVCYGGRECLLELVRGRSITLDGDMRERQEGKA